MILNNAPKESISSDDNSLYIYGTSKTITQLINVLGMIICDPVSDSVFRPDVAALRVSSSLTCP